LQHSFILRQEKTCRTIKNEKLTILLGLCEK
jgi:hypothetical protein